MIFKTLHAAKRGFIMPNAWDAGSAAILAGEGFSAIATTSAGIAFSLAKPDYDVRERCAAVSREAMLDRCREIAAAVTVPVNADLEDGYGANPETVAQTIAMAIERGLAGGNVEDNDPCGDGLYEERLAVERIRAGRAAIDARGGDFVLTARVDAYLLGEVDALATSIRRGNLFREAGADCIFVPAPDLDAVRRLVREIDAPLNVVMGLGSRSFDANELLDAGVARVSLGGSIARSALGFVRRCARELMETGMLNFAAEQIPQRELNALFYQRG